MTSEALNKIADVDIDPQGVFKYILIKVYAPEVAGKEPSKMIVRGYKICPYHGKSNSFKIISFVVAIFIEYQGYNIYDMSQTYIYNSYIHDYLLKLQGFRI